MINLIDMIIESEKKEQKKLLSSFIEWLYIEESLSLIELATSRLSEHSFHFFRER